ncbi:unnamed protein product [Discosporangium mesarthrocarpum]
MARRWGSFSALSPQVRPGEGGTALLSGSHKTVCNLLWTNAGCSGLTGPQLSSASREALLPTKFEDVIETVGSAGDVMLTHPMLLHARSKNLGTRGKESIRFMCHPAVPLHEHIDFMAPPATFPPVQLSIWKAWGSQVPTEDLKQRPIVWDPTRCDHTPVLMTKRDGMYSGSRGAKKRRRFSMANNYTQISLQGAGSTSTERESENKEDSKEDPMVHQDAGVMEVMGFSGFKSRGKRSSQWICGT